MDEREEFKQGLEAEFQWVKYRIRMLNIIQEKLLLMKNMAEVVKKQNLSKGEIQAISAKINNLSDQVRALDEESRKYNNSII